MAQISLTWAICLTVSLFPSAGSLGAGSTASPSPTGSASPTDAGTASPSPSLSPSPSGSATPTETPTVSPTPTGTPTVTPSPTPTPTFWLGQYSIDVASSPWVVVNKRRPLIPINYKPKTSTPVFVNGMGSNPYGLKLAKPAAIALVEMGKAAFAESRSVLVLSSGYRSYSTQTYVHKQKVAQLGKVVGENLAARPGYSEHQTGLAADLSAVGQGCAIRTCFSKTVAGKWLAANSHRFGFVLRYPNGRTAVTGYQFEPWHFRYVGVELATYIKANKITALENVWQLPAAPTY